MPLVKKIHQDWTPSEKPDLKVGDVIYMTNAQALVDSGLAVYVDDKGNEMKRKEVSACEICTKTFDDPWKKARHILDDHPQKEEKKVAEDSTYTGSTTPSIKTETTTISFSQKSFKDMTAEEKKEWRLANLKKAREEKKAKQEADLTANALKEAVASQKKKNE